MQDPPKSLSEQAGSFAQRGRIDVAAVFYAAAAQDPGATESQQWAARQNAFLCGEKTAEGILDLLDGVAVDGVGKSRRIADASAMRLDVELDLLHVDVADASP
eukprot:3717978-Pyramimonas_sp.AAC.1